MILVKESGGAAQAISEYVEPLLESVHAAADDQQGGGSGDAAEDDKETVFENQMSRLINEKMLEKRDAEFADRLRSLLGWRGQHAFHL